MIKSKLRINGSCGGQGCSVRIVLPHDSRLGNVSARVLSTTHDPQEIFSLTVVSLQEELKKAA